MDVPLHERIDDPVFRDAVRLLDVGNVEGLRVLLALNPGLARQRVEFAGRNYFKTPSLLEFIAENPVRQGRLPANSVPVAEAILAVGVDPEALTATLELVSTGRVARECGVQVELIDLLCDYGADAGSAVRAAAAHGEMGAVEALMRRGAKVDLPVAAALGRVDECSRELVGASAEDRHLALALAAQRGHGGIVRLLLEAGEDPDRYNPGGAHAHSTPLHQAALAGHEGVVRALVEHGARLDIRDAIWQGTPADWARHGGRVEVEAYLRAQQGMRE